MPKSWLHLILPKFFIRRCSFAYIAFFFLLAILTIQKIFVLPDIFRMFKEGRLEIIHQELLRQAYEFCNRTHG